MLIGFKTELKLNNKQRTALSKHAGVARHAYNQGLALTFQVLQWNQANPLDPIKFPSAIDLHKWLVASIKSQYPWYYEVSKCAPQYALRQLRDAWNRCFRKISGVPKFKKKGQADSFTLDGSLRICGDYKIKVPKIGTLRTYERLPQTVSPKSLTISRQADNWFISFKLEVTPQLLEKANQSVGVDLGIKHFATLSNGEIFDVPDQYQTIKHKIAKLQYLSRNKVNHSHSWRKCQNRIANLYYRLSQIRSDWLHKLTSYLAKTFKVICVEDLNVKGMMANHKLAGAIAELGWFEFRRQLEYKCQLYGSQLKIISRWEPSSKLHHKCDYKNDGLTLSDRVFYCPVCDESIDRDLNAALNLERFGLSLRS